MHRIPSSSAALVVIGLLAAACSSTNEHAADLVFRGGTVWTGDSLQPEAHAVAIRKDRIVYVGDENGVDSLIGASTRVVTLGNRLLMPGFVDTHVHPVSAGVQLGECNLADIATIERLREVVAECNARDPNASWIRGGGFALPLFAGGTPTAALLDSLVPGRPAFLSSADGHNGWANSRALAIAGITRDTRDPVNGVIVRDARGNAVGTLRESAQELVQQHIPPHTREEMRVGLERAVRRANQLGITSWHEASADEEILRAYTDADSLGRLTVRTVVALHVNVDSGPEQVQGLAALRDRYARPMVRPVAAKIFADGVLEGGTAALLADYTDRPGFRGDLNLPPARFNAIARALDSAGFKIHVHAIGDRAIRTSLDAIEQRHGARRVSGGPRPMIVHIQLFNSTDISRFASLGVVASWQALWAFRDTYMKELTEPRIGPTRARWQYPLATMARTGAIMAGGSDWFVSSLDPLQAIRVAVTRQSPDDSTDAPFFPEERVDVETMLKAYTLGGAMASDAEQELGTIAVGKLADVIVLSADLRRVSPFQITRTPVVLTVLGGREVWRDSTAFK
ncbi:MAG TPA: amidohydrolase [Gemmatimonadaceae bacterium]|nr:amidohydrolase [Gemmatimonadaceae bacterium]